MKQIITQIHKLPTDTSQIRQLSYLGYEIREVDSLLSKKLITEALTKSISIKNNDAIANSYRLLGLWHSSFDYKDKAFECYKASLNAAKKNNHLYYIAGAYFNMGNVKYWNGEYEKCIDYFLKTQDIFDDPKIFEDKTLTNKILDKRKSDLYYNMSAVFNTIKNLPKADEYIDKALAIANNYKNKTIIAFYTQQKADNYFENGNTKKALKIRLKYLPELEKSKIPKTYIQGYYYNIALEYFELNKIDSSKVFAQKSLNTATEIKIKDGIANSLWQLGRIAMKEKQYLQADKYFNDCSNYYLQSNDPTEKRNYFDVMRQFFYETKKYKIAYEFFEKYSKLNDTILVSESTDQFSEREAKYQSEKKDTQITLQKATIKQKKIFNYALMGTLLGFLVIAFLGYRNYKAKQTIQLQHISKLEDEKQIDAAQNVIQGEEAERTRLARDLHDGLGGMLSGVKFQLNTMKGNVILSEENALTFTKSITQLDNAISEMRRVAHNMMPEALLKFGLNETLQNYCDSISENSGLNVAFQSFGLENRLDQTVEIVIYRIVQELLNNTLKHANASQSHIQLSRNNNTISLTVEDNGKGFNINLVKKEGIGLANIQHRVDYLKGKMDVQSDKKGTSTHIEFELA
ncbi:sensor histidine kinase [Flavobacterium sp.]|uniref:tetratricopeptide repeat-containing sensor histidine kinase n=1 Tax=Flavobacterium sp. TaxID=239 RepID=UPI0032661AB0